MISALEDVNAQGLDARTFKLRLMGGLLNRTKGFSATLNRPKIQRLFDAVACDLSRGQQRIDPDIGSLTEEALRKAVIRALATDE